MGHHRAEVMGLYEGSAHFTEGEARSVSPVQGDLSQGRGCSLSSAALGLLRARLGAEGEALRDVLEHAMDPTPTPVTPWMVSVASSCGPQMAPDSPSHSRCRLAAGECNPCAAFS